MAGSEIRGDAPSLREFAKGKAKPYRSDDRFGILNPFGDLWTPETFATPKAAADYLFAFWRGGGFGEAYREPRQIGKFKVVPVKVTVSVSSRKDGSSPQTEGAPT